MSSRRWRSSSWCCRLLRRAPRHRRQRELGRGRRGLPGVGRVRLGQGRTGPADRGAGRRARRRCGCTRSTPATCGQTMHQAAYPGEDISDRPEPDSVCRRGAAAGPAPAVRALPRRGPADGGPRVSVDRTTRFELPRGPGGDRTPGGARPAPRRSPAAGRHSGRGRHTPGSPTWGGFLSPGDLLVVNTSGTVAAAVGGRLSTAGRGRAFRGPAGRRNVGGGAAHRRRLARSDARPGSRSHCPAAPGSRCSPACPSPGL